MSSPNEQSPLLRERVDILRSKWTVKKKPFPFCVSVIFLILFALSAAMFIWILLIRRNDDIQVDTLNQLLRLDWPLPAMEKRLTRMPRYMVTELENVVDKTKDELRKMGIAETGTGRTQDIGTPSFKHQHSFIETKQGNAFAMLGYIENLISKNLSENSCIVTSIDYTSELSMKWLSDEGCYNTHLKTLCFNTKYRSLDGSCNNLKHPDLWGVSLKPFKRLLEPEYEDCISDPRGGFEPNKLPSARDVSISVHRPIHEEDSKFTLMLAVWGQFIDHDITATALTKDLYADGCISCCNKMKNTHPACFPVIFSSSDQFYSKYNTSCMEFVRSAPALRCSFGPREQLNQASSYIDGSMIYGNNKDLNQKLRSLKGGEMKVSYTADGRTLLPISTNLGDGCNSEEEIRRGRYCFLTGDRRANENTHLTLMHLLFVRHHNKIAKWLAASNPEWNDGKIYEETRRIVIAQIQHITYNEFVPLILGKEIMTKLDLYPQESGHWNKYNSSIDATISNSFATAAFRFAHTLIPSMVKVSKDNGEKIFDKIEIHRLFFNPHALYVEGKMNNILKGALETNVEKADNLFSTQLTEHLFENFAQPHKQDRKSCGLDLVSLNIQRGRDHGLPGYPKWAHYCGLPKPRTFDQLIPYLDTKSVEIISSIYRDVDDIDVYTGALSEIPIKGGLLGPTFTCLIVDQFLRLKYGDRFWYETDESPQLFTPEQLTEIKKSTLAGIICDNVDSGLKYIQSLVMKSISKNNEEVRCSEIPQLNLTYWVES